MSYAFTDRAGDEQDGIARADARAEESLREQRWAAFVAEIGLWPSHFQFDFLMERVGAAWDAERRGNAILSPLQRIFITFAETEGWHGVLNAIARAMQEEANARAKAEVAASHGDAPCRPSPLSELGE